MNNNSLSGQIPPQLSRLPSLLHFQLDNNNFSGSLIPASYGNMSKLLKLSLRNCSLQGAIPDLSEIPQLGYLDLSWNQLTGPIPTNRLSSNITTIDLSHNNLIGSIPSNFSGLPNLQRLSLEDNQINGSVPSTVWNNFVFTGNNSLILDFQYNSLTGISSTLNIPANVTIMLYGNPVCAKANQLNISQLCQSQVIYQEPGSLPNSEMNCRPCPTDRNYEYNPSFYLPCFCAIPLGVGYRLKSPGFTDFRPYYDDFEKYLTSGLDLFLYQLFIDAFFWEEGPRLRMNLKLFPDNASLFNTSEILRIRSMFTGWLIPDSDIFGPYELLGFSLGSYAGMS